MQYSFSHSNLVRLPRRNPGTKGRRRAHHRDKQIGNARTADVAERCESVTINAIKQQHAPTENRPFVHWLKRARGSELLGIHHHFEVTRVEFFHAAFAHNAAAADEHETGENIPDLLHLMR